MYNSDIKSRYIEFKQNTTVLNKHLLNNIFTKTQKLEEEYGKDVCNFSYYEISEFYKILNIDSLGMLNSMNSQLSLYTSWCIQEGLVFDGQNHFSEFSSKTLSEFLNVAKVNKSIITREEIVMLCDRLLNPRDSFIILALFEYGKSMDFTDISHARLSDIDGNILTLYSGRKVYISDKLKNIAYAASNAEFYYNIGSEKRMTLRDNGTIIKVHANSTVDDDYAAGRRIYTTIVKTFNEYNMSGMTANKVVMSGILNMVLQRSKEIGITPMDYLNSDYIKEIENQYGVNRLSFKYGFILKYADYLK